MNDNFKDIDEALKQRAKHFAKKICCPSQPEVEPTTLMILKSHEKVVAKILKEQANKCKNCIHNK